MRLPNLIQLAALVALGVVAPTLDAAPAEASENLGICEHDVDRPTASEIETGLEWCFDGELIELRNESAVVLRVTGGEDPVRSLLTWSPGGDEVVREEGDPRILPPGYSLVLRIGASEASIEVVADGSYTSLFQKEQLRTAAYGFVPVAGDALDFVAAANSFIGEVDDITVNYRDCMQRASNFFGEAGCKIGFSGNATFAVSRAIVAGVPIVNDAPKVVKLLWRVAEAALAGEELVADPLVDLGDFVVPRTILVPGTGDFGLQDLVLEPDRLGPLALGMSSDDALATGLLEPFEELCFIEPVDVASLREPLEGAVFAYGGVVQAISVRSEIDTSPGGYGPGDPLDDLVASFRSLGFGVEVDRDIADVFGEGFVYISQSGEPAFGATFDPVTGVVYRVDIPSVLTCE